MIVPPSNTSFYTVLLDSKAAVFTVSLLGFQSEDITKVLVTSKDISSDIEAMEELKRGTMRIAAIVFEDQQQNELQFNPLYLPNSGALLEDLELTPDGDILSIAGFGNPYVSASIVLGDSEHPNMIDGKVNYKQFALPELHEIFSKEVLPS